MVYKYIPKREASKIIYLALSIDPEGIVVLVLTK